MIEAVISGLDVVYATSDDRGCSKPPVEAFEVALRISSAKPAQAAVIGDSVYDARDSVYDAKAAKRAAIITVGVLCGGTPKYLLREAGCTAVYRDPPICCRETVLRLAPKTSRQTLAIKACVAKPRCRRRPSISNGCSRLAVTWIIVKVYYD